MVSPNSESLVPPPSKSVSPSAPSAIKEKSSYGTIQISSTVKEQIVDYCERKSLKIGKFIEKLFLAAVSGSK